MPRKKNPTPRDMPTMTAQCKTCPFNPGGDHELAQRVIGRTLLKASQLCHSTAVNGRRETHLCKGARDLQCKALHAMGLIPEATDEAFRDTSERILGDKG